MKWNEMINDGYGRILETMERVLNGLTYEDLKWQPSSETNPIGWLCWHLTRGQDRQIADLMGEEQVWMKSKWYEKFNRPGNPRDMGTGQTLEQVAAFEPPDTEVLLGYLRETTERTQNYLNTISEDGLDRELNEPQWTPVPTVGVRIVSILADNLQHAGQAAYVRGLKHGKGWQSF